MNSSIEKKDDLPFLIRLVDDPSPSVRDKVAARLKSYGTDVLEKIAALPEPLTRSQQLALEAALGLADEKMLFRVWQRLQDEVAEEVYLENASLLLLEWQSGPEAVSRYRDVMDSWAAEFLGRENEPSGLTLASFLFRVKGLTGVDSDDYYDPLNSNLLYCLENGRGLPITLSTLFILMGHRVGVQIAGCNFPGHFLARDVVSGTVFDPYNARVVPAKEVAALRKVDSAALDTAAPSRAILGRVLRNLCLAYHHAGETEKTTFLLSLTREIKDHQFTE